jgi:LCP family protein required for cell wall assembly
MDASRRYHAAVVAPGTSWKSFASRFAIALVVVVIAATLFVNTGNRWFEREFDKIPTTRIREDVLAEPVEKGEPANFLIIGTDSRAFVQNAQQGSAFGTAQEVAGQRSDTMMVVHVDPNTKSGFVVSFPRDTWVNIPGHGDDRLNAALERGGPSLLIETISANFGVPIQHYIEVDIAGFQQIVNTIGGVHVYFPTPARDSFSGLDQPEAGCRELDGAQALGYVRSRHYQWYDATAKRWREDPRSDLSRIERQQYFMRSLAQSALDHGAGNPATALALATNISKSLQKDQNLQLSDIKTLINAFRNVDPSQIEMQTLPVVGTRRGTAQVLVPQQPQAEQLVSRLRTFSWLAVLPKPEKPGDFTVRVVNASGRPGLGAQVRDALTRRGLRVDDVVEDAPPVAQTQVQFLLTRAGAALTLMNRLGNSNSVPVDAAQLGRSNVVAVIGQDWGGIDPTPTHPVEVTSVPPSTVSTTTTSTTTTIAPRTPSETAVVPVDPSTGGTLVGCP